MEFYEMNTTHEPLYNRVLLYESAFFRPYIAKDGLKGKFADGSSLPFLLEEIIAHSARQIAVAPTNTSSFVDALSPQWRKRVYLVDEKGKIKSSLIRLFKPIGDEFGIKFNTSGVTFKKSQVREDLKGHTFNAFQSLYPFLIGVQHQLQIDVNIDSLSRSLKEVRIALNDTETRRKLAALEGALHSYKPTIVPGLMSISPRSSDFADMIGELLDDELYCALSDAAQKIGFPDRMKKSCDNMLRKARKVVRKSIFKGVYNVGSIGITAATQIPVPKEDTVQALLGSKYLPPVIDLKSIVTRARKSWILAEPIPIPPSFVEIGELLKIDEDII